MGMPYSLDKDGETYYYILNLQGDVVAIDDDEGNMVVYYVYDAWGNLISMTDTSGCGIGTDNILRYRGYVYDEETRLYYLQSRYYNPEWGRFINADNQLSTGSDLTGMNLFAYCGNNPVNRKDVTGQSWQELRDAFTQTLQQASQYFAIALGITQLDTPVPGPADVAAGVVAVGVLASCAVISVGQVIKKHITEAKRTREYQYWEAYNVKGEVVVGRGITFVEASLRVAGGLNIMCADQGAAKTLTIVNGYWNAVGPEIHGDEGYYWHYHPNRYSHTHIWFY